MDWDARYAAAQAPLFGDAPNVYLTMIAGRPDFAARSVLMLADGDGRNGTWAAARGMAVTAVDISGVATAQAAARDRAAGVSVERITANLMQWRPDPDRLWDAAAILFLQGPEAVRMRALRTAMDALAPGGWLILEGFDVAQGSRAMGPSDADRLYDLDRLIAALDGWRVIEALRGLVRLDEGTAHRGEAMVVRLAARRPG